MKKKSFRIIYLLFFIVSGMYGQDKKMLEEKRKKIQSELEQAAKLLQETQKNQETSVNEIQLIKKKLDSREESINTYSFEVNIVDKQIAKTQKIIVSTEADLKKMKKEYAEMIQKTFKTRSDYDKMMFILSAQDFNQAYKRIKYLQQYSEYRQKQMESLKNTQIALNNRIADLKKLKGEKLNLLVKENEEKVILSKEKNQYQSKLQELKTKEKDIKKDIDKKQKEVASLKKAIEEVIAKEIAAMEAAKKNKAKETPKEAKEAKEATVLMDKFEKNKGNFPWPVEKGIVTSKFGRQKHEVLQNIEVNNNGIDITAASGSEARAIFEGVVSKIIAIPNAGKAVLIRHGEYLSVYFQLNEIYVSPGDKVTTQQKIGSINTNSDNKTELHFELWKGKVILNPSEWLNDVI